MGILYDSVKMQQELKHKFVIEKLLEVGITESQEGTSIYELDYEELKYELVMASFRQIDTQNDQNKWF
ncbi:hypothetical protein ACFYKT_16515 [Cytobacillus sp. FJAT-53684]|uniref:Fur-regulated basic protein FbpA n=1 Tax=Cytobacillus mangrovibacter TaxID=3299024 RepID=A0ABW6K197_9BACI